MSGPFLQIVFYSYSQRCHEFEEDEYSLFKTMDKDSLKIGSEAKLITEWLELINPQYLVKYHKDVVENYFHVSGYSIGMLRNLSADEECFNAIRNKFSAEIVLRLPYLEQMQVVETLTRYEYTSKFLLNEMPKVMGSLIGDGSAGAIIDLETVHYRNSALRNLLDKGEEKLSVWYEPLLREYSKAVNGKNYSTGSETKIADDYVA